MTIPRSRQISLSQTPYYHCTTRCVRRAFLCGKDKYSGKNFDHRKAWMEQRMVAMADIFAIRLMAYAIMSNHYHVVVKIDSAQAGYWTGDEVIRRWSSIFSTPDNISKENIADWRERLCNLSWYMRCLNEPLARTANKEDDCVGRFWEGRFKCQALLDEAALLRCMTYVDLNPIRSGLTSKPESSYFTSIYRRITGDDDHLHQLGDPTLEDDQNKLISNRQYLSLVDWTGRRIAKNKRGRIPPLLPPLIERLDIDRDDWVDQVSGFGERYFRAAGSATSMNIYCNHLGQHWLRGMPQTTSCTVLAS